MPTEKTHPHVAGLYSRGNRRKITETLYFRTRKTRMLTTGPDIRYRPPCFLRAHILLQIALNHWLACPSYPGLPVCSCGGTPGTHNHRGYSIDHER